MWNIKNMKKKIIIALVLVVIATTLVIIYRYQQKHYRNITGIIVATSPQTQTSNTTIISSTTQQQTISNHPGMKLYRNEQWGFEFWYPEEWEWEENTWGNPRSKFNLTLAKIDGKNTNDLSGINITTPEFITSSYQDLREKSEIITVDGVKSFKYKYIQDPVQYTDVIIPINASTSIIIGDAIIGLKSDDRQGFNQILSTFKFLNKVKTYRNEQYGFEYQYPLNLTLKEINFPTYIFIDTGETCKNLLHEEFRPHRLLNQTTLVDPSTKFKVEVVTINIYENADNLSLNDWLNVGTKFLEKYSEECKYNDRSYIEIRLNDKKSVTIDNTLGVEGFAGCCMVSNKNIYLARNNKIYELSFSGSINVDLKCVPFADNEHSCPMISEDIFNQILASFKFLK